MPYSALICGSGGAGRHVAGIMSQDGRASITGLFEPETAQLEKSLVAHPNALAGDDYERLLDQVNPDIVVVAGPDHLHADQSIMALEHGCHVLIEKPLATTAEDAQRIIDTQERTGLQVMTDHTVRYMYPWREMALAARAGEVGRVFFIQGEYIHDLWSHYNPESPHYTAWRIDNDNPQNILLGGGCHPIDIMLWTIDSPVTEVFAYSSKLSAPEFPSDDCYILVMRFENEALGKVFVTSGCSGNQWTESGCGFLAVYGTNGTLYKGDLSRRHEEAVTLEDSSGDAEVGGHGWGSSVTEFLDTLDGKIENPIPARVGARIVAVCEAAIESNRTGQPRKPVVF
ncbi:MAG: Gfo/Idh/MocA family oxidoreductase [Gemmatimonadota bacterium]|nr:Gfo/Idh/MocA family oxidoreductase [Gemmatimonadota bacterium]